MYEGRFFMYKQRIYDIVCDDGSENPANSVFSNSIIILIIINVLMVILENFELSDSLRTFFYFLETVSVVIFTIEYILRLWTIPCKYADISPAQARFKHVFSFMAIIDLAAILPFYLPLAFPVNMIVLRLLRLLRFKEFDLYPPIILYLNIAKTPITNHFL
jgi:voltage-gated potassium channel